MELVLISCRWCTRTRGCRRMDLASALEGPSFSHCEELNARFEEKLAQVQKEEERIRAMKHLKRKGGDFKGKLPLVAEKDSELKREVVSGT